MLTNPTIEQMQTLGLPGMAKAYRDLDEQPNANELNRDEWLGLMLDREISMRADKRLGNRLPAAKLRFPEASIEDIDFTKKRGLDRRNTMALAQGNWLTAFENLMARLDGRFPRLIDKLAKVQLLILDDWGTHSLADQQRFHLFEIVEERYQRRSTLITSQIPVAAWHELIGDATVADAILDRIVHNAHRINLEGDSMRKQKSAPLLTAEQNAEIIQK